MTSERHSAAEGAIKGVEELSPESSLEVRFRRRVLAIALWRLGDRSAAEDVAQETLKRVLEALRERRIENLEALPAFVYQTARHVLLQRQRKTSREEKALRRFGWNQAASESEPALGALIDAERRQRVQEAMTRLGDGDRHLLRLLYYEELDPRSVAERLGLTNGALRVRRHRALKRLGLLLDEDSAE